MATSKFKAGDRVKRTNSEHGGMKIGDVGTVAEMRETGSARLHEPEYNTSSVGGMVWHAEYNLELHVEPITVPANPDPVPGGPDTKPTNPKDAIGNRKLQLGLLPFAFQAATALALTDGKYKYGAHNWTIGGVRASIYIDAMLRHVARYNGGQQLDPDSRVHNLGHAAACIAILLDAEARGVLNDDRPPSMNPDTLLGLQEAYNTITGRLIDTHVAAGRAPYHYSVLDDDGSGDAD